jgi:hypothetical protein|tara:strand:- start:1602 stop:3332 length:1731 start_codon:yes stop_codon:yes gene_type:complete
MSETRIDDNDINEGLYPDVFKKIDTADIQINPFQAHKTFTVSSGSVTSSILPVQGVYTDTNNLPAIGSNLNYNKASNIDGSLQSVIYFSTNHLFYKRKNQPSHTYGPTNLNRTNKFLYETASIFSVPQIKIGNSIKPASFTFTSSVSGSFESDRYGNIIDSAFDTASIITDTTLYEGFNEYFDTTRIKYSSAGVTYVDGIPTTSGRQLSLGLAAQFNGAGFIQQELPGFYDRNNDYAISFFISGGNTTVNDQVIITKSTSSLTPQCPFKIELTGTTFLTDENGNTLMTEASEPLNIDNNKIQFSAQGSTNYKSIINSTSDVSSSWHHVVCQKSGSNLQLYVNGTLEASEFNTLLEEVEHPLSASARIDNIEKLSIGGYNTIGSDISFITDQNNNTITTQDDISLTSQNNLTDFNLQGLLDEIRIFNKSLTSAEITNLGNRSEGGSVLQTQYVGNVFDKHGLFVFSSADYRVDDLLNTPYTLSYESTVTIHELSVVARLGQGEFNMSNNITLTKDDNYTYRDFVSGSAFSPYVTSIGLYNDLGQLLAVAKLAQPVRKRNDVDINFLVRIDLDKKIIK